MGFVEFRNVFFEYGAHKVLRDISFDIKEGEVIGIMGDVGSGKTSLLKLVNGLLKPTSGEVYINLLNTLDYTVADLSRYIGFMFQNPQEQLFQNTVYDEIVFGLKYKNRPNYYIETRLEEVSELLEIGDILDRKITELPYYKKKLVALATVMIEDRDLVVLDDPVQGLDRTNRFVVEKCIKELRKEDKTVLVTSNNLKLLMNSVDKILLLDRGRLVGFDTVYNILSSEELLQIDMDRPLINRLAKNIFSRNDIFKEKDFIKLAKEKYNE